jgi:predicted MFS family arabinose efflux permease
VALLWPARARKGTARAAGIAAGLPLGLTIVVSMAGASALTPGLLVGGAVMSVVFGLPLGAFMYDYDR